MGESLVSSINSRMEKIGRVRAVRSIPVKVTLVCTACDKDMIPISVLPTNPPQYKYICKNPICLNFKKEETWNNGFPSVDFVESDKEFDEKYGEFTTNKRIIL